MKIHPETGKVLTGFHVDVEPQTRYTCFISHSSKDLPFIQKLHTDLQANNVVCWYAPENLKIGDKFWYRINESIEGYDKFLVILSENSLESEWVEKEVMAALEKEDKQPNRLVLFPIMIDKAVTKTKKPWAAHMRQARHIGDFTQWESLDAYQKALNSLLRDLTTAEKVPSTHTQFS